MLDATLEIINKVVFNPATKAIFISAVTSIVLTGGTNYVLQKTNRKGNLLADKGLLFINKIIEVEEERIEAMKYCTFIIGFSDEQYNEAYNKYHKGFSEFVKFVKVHSFLLSKKTNSQLNNYLEYLDQPLKGIQIMRNNEPTSFIIDVNKSKAEDLSEEIIFQIKRQMV